MSTSVHVSACPGEAIRWATARVRRKPASAALIVALAHRTPQSADGVERLHGSHLQRVCKTDESWVFQTAS